MPSLKEAGLRHAEYYAGYTKQHQEELPVVWQELPNLIPAYRFYATYGGEFDVELINFVTDLQRSLETDAYWQELIPMLTDAQLACERVGDEVKRAKLILTLAQMHTNLGRYDQAVAWIEQAIALAKRIGDLEALADGCRRMGWTLIYLGELTQALEHLAHARQFAAQCNRLDILASSHHFTGRAYFELGDYERSLGHFRSELRLPPEANGPGAWINSFHRSAETLIEMGKIKLAERLLLKCVREVRLLGVEGNAAPYLRALARVRLRQGYVQEAWRLLNESLQEYGYQRGIMGVRQDMAEVCLQTGRVDQALQLIEMVIAYRESSKERRQLADALYAKGRILEWQGDFQRAANCYRASSELFEKIKCLPTVSRKAHMALEQLKATTQGAV